MWTQKWNFCFNWIKSPLISIYLFQWSCNDFIPSLWWISGISVKYCYMTEIASLFDEKDFHKLVIPSFWRRSFRLKLNLANTVDVQWIRTLIHSNQPTSKHLHYPGEKCFFSEPDIFSQIFRSIDPKSDNDIECYLFYFFQDDQ